MACNLHRHYTGQQAQPRSASAYRGLLQRTLFIELSDGARIDAFRRTNVGTISNEQVVTAPRINEEKWGDSSKSCEKTSETGTRVLRSCS